jgi:hypothetical protein
LWAPFEIIIGTGSGTVKEIGVEFYPEVIADRAVIC